MPADPKGRLTVALMQHAATYYKEPDLEQHVLGATNVAATLSRDDTWRDDTLAR